MEITAPLSRSWAKIEKARRIGIKINMQMRTNSIRRIGGRRQELVDDDVMRAALRLLRERSDAEIFALDTSTAPPGERPGDDFNARPILEEFGVEYVEAGDPPFERYKVPGGGIMFSEYQLSAALGEADAFVSLAKMKKPRFYGHHPVPEKPLRSAADPAARPLAHVLPPRPSASRMSCPTWG